IGEGPAAGRDDDVARCQLLHQNRTLDGAEIGFAVARKNVGDRQVLARLDQLVDVDGAPFQTAGQRPADGGFAGAHEPDQIDLVRLHQETTAEGTLSYSAVARNPAPPALVPLG